jgi:hypothetical protein
MASPQANGYYPRLNAAMVARENSQWQYCQFDGLYHGATDGKHVSFCSDGNFVTFGRTRRTLLPTWMSSMDGPVVVVGQVIKETKSRYVL